MTPAEAAELLLARTTAELDAAEAAVDALADEFPEPPTRDHPYKTSIPGRSGRSRWRRDKWQLRMNELEAHRNHVCANTLHDYFKDRSDA